MNQILKLMQCQNPLKEFAAWLEVAKQTPAIREPTAMIIATASKTGQPSTRAVLLKALDEQGLTFFTNYSSRKAQEIETNPKLSATFYWDPLIQQVHFRGRVEKTSRSVSENYWNTRPHESQLSQWISRQSEVLPEGADLAQLIQKAEQQWKEKNIPCPDNWGGYKLIPNEVEFWIGNKYRLHDRVQFQLNNSNWLCQRLYP